jgi:6-phosphogluconolactonase
MLKSNWLVFQDEESLVYILAQEILHIAKKSIEVNDRFSIVLTGGSSVLSLYKILSKSDSNWNKWYVYIGDERCLPIDDKDRNDLIINKIWLCNNLIPKNNIYFIEPELGLLKAREKYEEILKQVNKFDVVLLSVGEDGHISSLFPNHVYPKDQDVIVEYDSPKLPKERISMSYERLDKACNIFKVIIGKSKQPIVKLLLQEVFFPVNMVCGEIESVFIHNNAIPIEYK